LVFCDLCGFIMKPISPFPLIALLVITVLLILMFLGYFQ